MGFRAAIVIQFATRALQTAYPPAAFEIAKEDPDAKTTLARLARFFFVGTFGLALALSAVAPELAAVFAPREHYAASFQVIPWIAFSLALHSAVLNVMIGVAITKRNVLATLVVCSAGALKLVLNPLFIGLFGIVGAAAATLVSFLAELALAFYITQRVYPLAYEVKRLWTMAAIFAASAAAVYAASFLPITAGLPLRLLLFAAALVALRVFGVFSASELRSAKEIVLRRKRTAETPR